MRRFLALSHSGKKFGNVREARLTAYVNAGNAARREVILRLLLQPRGSEESRLLVVIHERVDLQHEITCSTFFHDEWVSLPDFLGCCAMYFSHRAYQKNSEPLFRSSTRMREEDKE